MKYFINIANKKYRIQEIDRLSLKDYKYIEEIINSDDDIIEISKRLLKLLTAAPNKIIDSALDFDLMNITWNDIIKIKETKLKSKYNMTNISFVPYEYHKLIFSRFVEIEQYLIDDNNLSLIIATIILNKDLTEEKLDETMKIIDEDLRIADANAIIKDYLSWRKETFNTFEDLFALVDEKNKEDEDIKEDKDDEIEENNWLKIAYSLTNDDITKIDEIFNKGIIEILNWLSYLKEKRDEEENRNKNTLNH